MWPFKKKTPTSTFRVRVDGWLYVDGADKSRQLLTQHLVSAAVYDNAEEAYAIAMTFKSNNITVIEKRDGRIYINPVNRGEIF